MQSQITCCTAQGMGSIYMVSHPEADITFMHGFWQLLGSLSCIFAPSRCNIFLNPAGARCCWSRWAPAHTRSGCSVSMQRSWPARPAARIMFTPARHTPSPATQCLLLPMPPRPPPRRLPGDKGRSISLPLPDLANGGFNAYISTAPCRCLIWLRHVLVPVLVRMPTRDGVRPAAAGLI